MTSTVYSLKKKISLFDNRLLFPAGFCLLDLTEQFSLPETSPPMLARLLEAIERKGELDRGNSRRDVRLAQNHTNRMVQYMY